MSHDSSNGRSDSDIIVSNLSSPRPSTLSIIRQFASCYSGPRDNRTLDFVLN